ncbi:MAG: MBL fold metallo-hydrolase [Myxococcales bacterium]|nr:MBL fold metallo-hydrolase [Myxococcales bacterium]
MIELTTLGAAKTVTGSKHLLRTTRAKVLLDCGLFQGHRSEANARNRAFSIPVDDLDAVVLSHAHLDHSGALPILYKLGYRGPVYCTPATRDLLAPMLMDSANIQVSDARHIAKRIARGQRDLEPVEPLYDEEDVSGLLGLVVSEPYHRTFDAAPGIRVTFDDAGHVLGSAIVTVDIEDRGSRRRLVFSGDLGRHHLPILRDPQVPSDADVLLMESTYGDRLHGPMEVTEDALCEVVTRTVERGGRVLIPSFALERAQEVVYALKKLRASGRLPKIPVYVDSPLTVALTAVFRLHPECYDKEAARLLRSSDSPFDFDGLRYVSDVDDSKAIDTTPGPKIIIAASGMCEGGRVLHHLLAMCADPKNTILIVGFQAEHTLGRRLVERRPEIRIFGEIRPLRAEVVTLNGFSAHADQTGLIEWADRVARQGTLSRIVLVHGEPGPQATLAKKLQEGGVCGRVDIPGLGETLRL